MVSRAFLTLINYGPIRLYLCLNSSFFHFFHLRCSLDNQGDRQAGPLLEKMLKMV